MLLLLQVVMLYLTLPDVVAVAGGDQQHEDDL